MASTARIEELRKKYEENQRRYFAPLANEYRKAGQLEEAIALCRAWLPQQPGHMSGHIVFGQTLFESGELSEARTVFETALELDPENLIALRHLGDIARQHGELGAARSWYKRVLDADPRNDEISALLSQLDALAVATPSTPSASEIIEPAWTDAAAEAEPSPLVAAADASPPPASAEEAAWGSATELEREVRSELSATRQDTEADSLFDATDGTVVFRDESADLTEELKRLEADAFKGPGEESPLGADSGGSEPSSGMGILNDVSEDGPSEVGTGSALGLEVMEFVPPPRKPSRTPRDEPNPFDGHLLEDDADGSGATPAAFVTETMAELYLQQGFRDEALGVYRQLLQQNPDDEALRDRVEQLERGSKSSVGMAAISDEVIESAQRRQVATSTPSVRAFLAKLAVRRAPQRPPAAIDEASDDSGEAQGGAEGAEREPTDPEPDAGFSAVTTDPAAWQVSPDESEAAQPGYAAPSDDPRALADADTAEWIAEDEERLSSHETVAAAADASPWDAASTRPETSPDEPAPAPPTRASFAEKSGLNGATGSTSRAPGSIGSLFAGAVIQAGDEAAAAALSSAFAPQAERPKDTMVGRPTRAAKSEISLDHVFRESGSRPAAQRERSSFSFDQFFSENASGGSSSAGEGSGTQASDEPKDDIEQFNSWLEGLKKK